MEKIQIPDNIPPVAMRALDMPATDLPEGLTKIRGYDFNEGVDLEGVMKSFISTGFQASHMGQAIETINLMIEKRLGPVEEQEVMLPIGEHGEDHVVPEEHRKKPGCTIFLGYTSNMISSGVRETIRYLVQHKMVDVLVSTAGGIEEDFIKCSSDTYLGDFSLAGKDLRQKGINRIGNILMPNDNYEKFTHWLARIMDQMLLEQETEGTNWTPSKMIHRLGKEINNPDSVYYWAYKNNIPVFSPALTDGAFGDVFYLYSFRKSGLRLDIAEDYRKLVDQAVYARSSGIIILGGGMVKHHICNCNLLRGGANYAVLVNTGQEFDGSDAGARPDEAISWGKIKADAKPVKVYGEATVVFPLLVAETFARNHDKLTTSQKAN